MPLRPHRRATEKTETIGRQVLEAEVVAAAAATVTTIETEADRLAVDRQEIETATSH